jgi:hypothetical protein
MREKERERERKRKKESEIERKREREKERERERERERENTMGIRNQDAPGQLIRKTTEKRRKALKMPQSQEVRFLRLPKCMHQDERNLAM